jgi:hypothetical protein
MVELKHVGRVKATGKKCLVAYRTLPGDAYHAVIIPTENLPDSYHDALIQLVESSSAQDSYEFADVLSRSNFPDGSTMLAALHTQGRMVRVPTSDINMTPTLSESISLDELNALIAEQRGVAIDDLHVQPQSSQTEVKEIVDVKDITPPKNEEHMTTEERAAKYRSEADRLYKEAAKLRKMALDLDPKEK